MGSTVHWIDESNFTRGSGCLALARVRGRTTYDVIAQHLDNIHVDFNIGEKILVTITDSGSNFLKSFAVYGPDNDKLEEEEVPLANLLKDDCDNDSDDEVK